MIEPLSPRENWLDLEDVTYLYTGAHAPALKVVQEALGAAFRQQSLGPAGRDFMYQTERTARTIVGDLTHIAPDGVAFAGNASTAWNLVANGLEWAPGDNVVINDLEHPSVTFPFLRLKPQGLEVRVVPRDAGWRVSATAIAEACDDHTRAIAVSHTAYVNGYRHDLPAISGVADRRGVPLFVDWSHTLGVLPVEMDLCAVGISASYKWTLGPYGVGILCWNRERLPEFRPGGSGWRSVEDIFSVDRFEAAPLSPDARRFEMGAPSFSGIAGLAASLNYLKTFGTDALGEHALALAGLCRDGLMDLGLQVVTPEEKGSRAGSVAFVHPKADSIKAALERRRIFVWGGDGRIRASFHLMNGEADVKTYVTELDDILSRLK